MKQKILYILKHILFIAIIIAVVIAVFAFSIGLQFLETTVSAIIGDTAWMIIYLILPIIAVLVPLIVKYAMKCNFKKSVLCTVISIGIYATVSLGTVTAAESYMQIFTPEKWEKHPFERHRMIDDLKEKYNLIGMKADEVTSLLGESEIPYAKPDTDEFLEYCVGSFSIDPTMLTFELKDGIVVEVYTYTEVRAGKEPLY